MRFWGCFLVCMSGLTAIAMAAGDSDNAEMIERMKTGGHVLMIRHALAPGTGDPANFRIGDCSTQRNLDEAFLLADDTGYLHRPLYSRYEGTAGFNNPAMNLRLKRYFTEVWERSIPDVEMRRLYL